MSTSGYKSSLTLNAAADLSAKKFRAIKVDSAGKAAVAGLGEFAIGVLQNNPGLGQQATVMFDGVTKMVCGGTVTPGLTVSSDANGAAVDAVEARTNTSDAGVVADPLISSNVLGVALTGGAVGEVISVLLCRAGATPTTPA